MGIMSRRRIKDAKVRKGSRSAPPTPPEAQRGKPKREQPLKTRKVEKVPASLLDRED